MADGSSRSHAFFRRVRLLVFAVVLTTLMSGVAALAPPPSAAAPSRLPKPVAEKVVPHREVVPSRAPSTYVDQPARTATTWPEGGSAEVVLGGDKPAVTGEPSNSAERGARVPVARQAGSLPVRIAAPAAGRTPTARVELAQRSVAERAGVSGVLLAVRPTSGPIDSATVTVDYSSFRHAGGADLGTRLRLVRLPECALATPHLPSCQVQSEVDSRNDGSAQSVSATVPVKGATVLAATAGSSGPGGSFVASSLGPSGSWGVTGSAGAFTWSYPITLPPTASGTSAMPDVTLSYNSAGVDGRTAATNNQASWVGQGWDYSPGFVERTYRSCADDTALPQAQQTGDLCWAGHIVTMSLGGRSTALVRNDADGTWRPASDDGARVELVSTGTPSSEYWRVTTTDGVKYHFGRNEGPGRTTQDTTNSRWTVPVYGPRNGDPCYNAAGFAQSKCDQVWRWNLDYVEDPHGNASLYHYAPESNYYGANKATTGVVYTRGGTLKRIDYGLRLTSGSVYGTAPGQVVFDVSERCTPNGAITCDPAQFTAANATHWPDTPQDQQCLSGATCNNHSPSFWSTKRLTSITTQYNTGSGPVKVDSYALTQTFPTQTDPSLRLDQIVRTAWEAGTTGTALPPVTFTSEVYDNRVSGYNNQPAMGHWRLRNVATETGGQVSVDYSPTECTSTTVPTDLPNNTKRCYPVYWRLPLNQNPTLDFFHVYPVTQVQVQDGNATSPTQRTAYTYLGAPAWHFDDNELVKPAHRTYGQFRGYGQVETRTGAGTDQRTLTKTTYFRGMHGDTLPGNQQRTATVTNSLGETRNDDNVFAGSAHETQTYLGDGGAQLSTSITELTDLATTATRARTGLPAATARIVAPSRTRDHHLGRRGHAHQFGHAPVRHPRPQGFHHRVGRRHRRHLRDHQLRRQHDVVDPRPARRGVAVHRHVPDLRPGHPAESDRRGEAHLLRRVRHARRRPGRGRPDQVGLGHGEHQWHVDLPDHGVGDLRRRRPRSVQEGRAQPGDHHRLHPDPGWHRLHRHHHQRQGAGVLGDPRTDPRRRRQGCRDRRQDHRSDL
ncbi:hypothetical protein JOD54_006280 [Actinokineospora baliensis]|uniref:hypothetical protein n=1 Tax=Actinokineospora baliensis TaxID=547056 RepID=UPI0023BA5751|nr:hypothetical protein [Actinokineospora baliensis]MBM7776076.1 hypothetical protein [Actinokineospora baliensis]